MRYKDISDSENDNNARWGYYFTNTNALNLSSNSGFIIYFSLFEKAGSADVLKFSNLLSSVVASSGRPSGSADGHAYMVMPPTWISIPFQFFVNKGSSVILRLYFVAHLYAVTNIHNDWGRELLFELPDEIVIY